ncbi:MAG: DUF5615 family PIN-like protein [Actinomycetota bacterium]|nr:DUF5615 family PIN-like protein [Actinomycetota bacterium]
MKLKLDENPPAATAAMLRDAGHDVSTVIEEHLPGAPDAVVARAAVSEQRVLFTLDRGMADPRAIDKALIRGSWCSGYGIRMSQRPWRPWHASSLTSMQPRSQAAT